MKLHPLQEQLRLLRPQHFHKRTPEMNVEVIQHQMNFLSFGIDRFDQSPNKPVTRVAVLVKLGAEQPGRTCRFPLGRG